MAPLLERFIVPIQRALFETGLSGKDFYAVEIVGGSMRIPAFKMAAAKAVGLYTVSFLCLFFFLSSFCVS